MEREREMESISKMYHVANSVNFLLPNQIEKFYKQIMPRDRHTVDHQKATLLMVAMTKEDIMNFIDNVFNMCNNDDIVFELYTPTKTLLEKVSDKLVYILTYMSDLRHILSGVLPLPAAQKLKLGCFHQTDKTDWVRSIWIGYSETFNLERQTYFNGMNLVTNGQHTQAKVDYFLKVEHQLQEMTRSVACAGEHLTTTLETLIDKFKKSYQSDCSNRNSGQCHTTCFWKGDTCHDKPFLIFVDQVVKVYCGSSRTEHTASDMNARQKLYDALDDIYTQWFGPDPIAHDSQCKAIISWYKTIRHTLDRGGEHVYWSQVQDLLQIQDDIWNDLWLGNLTQREQALVILQDHVGRYNDSYTNLLSQLTEVCARMRLSF